MSENKKKRSFHGHKRRTDHKVVSAGLEEKTTLQDDTRKTPVQQAQHHKKKHSENKPDKKTPAADIQAGKNRNGKNGDRRHEDILPGGNAARNNLKKDATPAHANDEESIFSAIPYDTYSHTVAEPFLRISSAEPLYEPEEAHDNKPNYTSDEKTRVPDFSFFDFNEKQPQKAETYGDDVQMVEVIGVRFKPTGKIYYFAPGDIKAHRGDFAIVETARGLEYGEVCLPNCFVPEKDIIQPLRNAIRIATPDDTEHHEENKHREKDAFSICLEKISKHGLDMKLVDAQYTFDNSKLLFYFTSAGRVDFRELVKDLASVFRTRIELRQIGIRDEAKLLGGIGACGRALCCSTFLSDFVQVSIKMAKEQSLSLNSNKISGACGRLMCCLRYEHSTYVEEIGKTPPIDSLVRTTDGEGVVAEMNPLAGTVKIRLNDKPDAPLKAYKREEVTVISRPASTDQDNGDTNGEADHL